MCSVWHGAVLREESHGAGQGAATRTVPSTDSPESGPWSVIVEVATRVLEGYSFFRGVARPSVQDGERDGY